MLEQLAVFDVRVTDGPVSKEGAGPVVGCGLHQQGGNGPVDVSLADHGDALVIEQGVGGAGHDAQMMARICPAGMIFVPSRAGLSHCPQEFTGPQDLKRGAQVLLETVLDLLEAQSVSS